MWHEFLRSTARGALAAVIALAAAMPTLAGAQEGGIDPEAVNLLKASTDFLARQQQLAAEVRSSLEVVLVSGQKIQFDQRTTMAMQRPNQLRAERVGDVIAQVFYYDGKTLTLSDLSSKHYATVPAPATFDAALEFARNELDVIAPAGDLLSPKAYDILMTDVSSGFVVGKSSVEGVPCTHVAFRAPHVDWQIWIQDGAQPLPRKLVITTRDLVNAPQFSLVITKWDMAPRFTDSTFKFTPAPDAQKIDFLPVTARSGR